MSLTLALIVMHGASEAATPQEVVVPQEGRKLTPEQLHKLEDSFEEYKKTDEYKWIKKRNIQIAHIRHAFSTPDFSSLLRKFIENEELFGLMEWTPEQEKTVKPIFEEIADLELKQSDVATKLTNDEFKVKRFELVEQLIEENMDFQSLEISRARLDGDLFNLLQNSELMQRYLDISDEQRKRILKQTSKISLEVRDAIRKARQNAADVVSAELTESQKSKLVSVYGAAALNDSLGKVDVEAMTYFMLRGSKEEKKFLADKILPSGFTHKNLNTFDKYKK